MGKFEGSTIFCETCSTHYTSSKRIKTQPFVSGVERTFRHWLDGVRNAFSATCNQCSQPEPTPLAVWGSAETHQRLEVESRVRNLRPGMFPISPSTRIQMRAGQWRLRDGEAIVKQHISQEQVFDMGGGFVRRVASLETWPVSYYSLLAHAKATIDWSRQTLVDRVHMQHCSVTRVMHESNIGYYENVERESNYLEPPLHEMLPGVEYESVDDVVNPTHVPSRAVLVNVVGNPLTLYSPKVDGYRRRCRLTESGAYMECPRTGLIEFIEIEHCPTIKAHLMAELVQVNNVNVYVLIDVRIDASVTQRIAQLNWLRQFSSTLETGNIYIQVFQSNPPRPMRTAWRYGSLTLPTDGYIISPPAGKIQYKLKWAWTIDLLITSDRVKGQPTNTLTGSSGDGHRIVRLPRDFSNTPKYVGEGVYECMVSGNGNVSLIRHRNDRESANLMSSIIQNIDLATMSLDEQRRLGLYEWIF